MKTPEEILSRYTDVKSENHFVIHTDHVGDCITISRAAFLIEKAQKEAWNEALDWAAKHVSISVLDENGDSVKAAIYADTARQKVIGVSKQSILKGKK